MSSHLLSSPRTLLIAAAALAATTAVTLPAFSAQSTTGLAGQTEQTRPAPLRATIMFNLIDRNADGTLDQDEIAALQKAIFSAIDKDGDGKLSQQEFSQIAQGMGGPGGREGRGFHRPGMDGRGPGFFHRGGPDGRQGMLQMEPGVDQQEQRRGEQLGENQGMLPLDGGSQPQDFASLDVNGDGLISADEFAAGAPGIPGIVR